METTNSDNMSQETPETPETKCFKRKSLLGLIVLGSSIFLAGCTLSLLAPFYTKVAEDHGLSITSSGAVFASAFVLQIVSTPIFGKYLQRIGSARLFVFGAIVSGSTNIIFGFLPRIRSGSMFLAMSLTVRSMTAVGESAMSTAVYPLAMRCAPSSQSTVLAVMETMFGAGTTIGPFVGGFLFEVGGFLAPFSICGGLLLVCGVIAYFVLSRDATEEEAGEEVSADGSNNDVEMSGEVTTLTPVTYRSLLGTSQMMVAAIATFLTGVSTQWYQPSLEPYVRNTFGLSSFQASLLFIIDGAVYSVCAPLTGKLLDRGVDGMTLLGAGSFIISLAYLVLAPVPPLAMEPSLEQIAIGAGIHGLGMAINFISTLTLMTQVAESISPGMAREQVHGMATSVWITAESLGGLVGSAGGGASFDHLGWRWSSLVVAGLQALAVMMVVSMVSISLVSGCRNRRKKHGLLSSEDKKTYGFANKTQSRAGGFIEALLIHM